MMVLIKYLYNSRDVELPTAFCRALTEITEIHVKSRSLPQLQEVAGSKT